MSSVGADTECLFLLLARDTRNEMDQQILELLVQHDFLRIPYSARWGESFDGCHRCRALSDMKELLESFVMNKRIDETK